MRTESNRRQTARRLAEAAGAIAVIVMTSITTTAYALPSHIVTNYIDLDGNGVYDTLLQNMIELPSGAFQSSLQSWDPYAGTLLRTINSNLVNDWFGFAFAVARDVNGDGADDVFVGAPLQGYEEGVAAGTGALRLISGATGSVVWSFTGQPGEKLGVSVAAIDDITGDGINDVAAGSVESDAGGVNAGRVYLLSGADGQPVHVIDGSSPDSAFGASITDLGDVDGDGVPDVAIGQPGNAAVNPNATGVVFLFSGATGQLIRSLQSPDPQPGDGFGTRLSSLGDLLVSNDGVNEFVATSPGRANAAAYVFSGADGSLRFTLASATTEVFGAGASARLLSGGRAFMIEIDTFATNHEGEPASKAWVYSASTGNLLFVETDPNNIVFPLASDVNADGVVDASDLLLVMDSLGEASEPLADVTRDGVVDENDVNQVINDLGTISPTGSPSNEGMILEDDTPPCLDGLDMIGGMSIRPCQVGSGGGTGNPPPPPPPSPSPTPGQICANNCNTVAASSRMRWWNTMRHNMLVCSLGGLALGLAGLNPAATIVYVSCIAAEINRYNNNITSTNITLAACLAGCPTP